MAKQFCRDSFKMGSGSKVPQQNPGCAILANRHAMLSEGIRGLLESAFPTVFTVTDVSSLREGMQRLSPLLVVLDISLFGGNCSSLLQELRDLSPQSRIIVLSVHDQPNVARQALASGAQGVILKRSIGNDLLTAISAVLDGEEFVSPGFGLGARLH